MLKLEILLAHNTPGFIFLNCKNLSQFLDDELLSTFLRGCKFSLERTKVSQQLRYLHKSMKYWPICYKQRRLNQISVFCTLIALFGAQKWPKLLDMDFFTRILFIDVVGGTRITLHPKGDPFNQYFTYAWNAP